MKETNRLLDTLKETIKEWLDDEWATQCDQYDFQHAEDYERYGDTWVSTGKYITDESDTAFREDFKSMFDFDTIMERLKEQPGFKETLMDWVKSYADSEDLYL